MKKIKILWMGILLMATSSLFAQDLSKSQIHSITQEIIKTVEENYIIPDLRDKIVAGLQSNLESGKYDAITTKDEFEKTMTADLLDLSDDKHLYLVLDKDDEDSKSNPRRQMRRMMPDSSAFKNLLSYELLEGNIAYLNVPMFGPLEYLQTDIDKYLELSLSADALIIDVRQCPGGSGETTAYLAGGFIAKPTHLTSYYSAEGEMKSISAETRFGEANAHKNVYVLVSERTGSAAEGFAFYLQQLGRVQVVGMQSAGAGRGNQFFPIQEDFSLSVSVRTSITPNGKQFQGLGVTPDVVTPSKNALNQAKIETFLSLKEESPNQASTYDNLLSKVGKPDITLQRGDMSKIKEAVLGYIENFFENNTEEMFKYLHPDLAKRGMSKKRGDSTLTFQDMSQEELKNMLSKKEPLSKEEQQNTIEILDVFYNSANVKLKTGYPDMKWIEYILLTRTEEGWKISDILWDYDAATKPIKKIKEN